MNECLHLIYQKRYAKVTCSSRWVFHLLSCLALWRGFIAGAKSPSRVSGSRRPVSMYVAGCLLPCIGRDKGHTCRRGVTKGKMESEMHEKRNISMFASSERMNKHYDDFSCVYKKNGRRSWGGAHAVFSKRLCLGRRVSIGGRGRMRQLSFKISGSGFRLHCVVPSLLEREVSNLDAFSTLTPKRPVLPFKIEKGRLWILSSGVYIFIYA